MICVPPAQGLLDFWNLTVSISLVYAAVIEYPTKVTLRRRGIMLAPHSRGLEYILRGKAGNRQGRQVVGD